MSRGFQADNRTTGLGFMERKRNSERVVVVHIAGTLAEAMVIRGLLESAGIPSPGSVTTDPFPLREPPEGTHGVEILVLDSHEAEARRVISEFLSSNASIEDDGSEGEPPDSCK